MLRNSFIGQFSWVISGLFLVACFAYLELPVAVEVGLGLIPLLLWHTGGIIRDFSPDGLWAAPLEVSAATSYLLLLVAAAVMALVGPAPWWAFAGATVSLPMAASVLNASGRSDTDSQPPDAAPVSWFRIDQWGLLVVCLGFSIAAAVLLAQGQLQDERGWIALAFFGGGVGIALHSIVVHALVVRRSSSRAFYLVAQLSLGLGGLAMLASFCAFGVAWPGLPSWLRVAFVAAAVIGTLASVQQLWRTIRGTPPGFRARARADGLHVSQKDATAIYAWPDVLVMDLFEFHGHLAVGVLLRQDAEPAESAPLTRRERSRHLRMRRWLRSFYGLDFLLPATALGERPDLWLADAQAKWLAR